MIVTRDRLAQISNIGLFFLYKWPKKYTIMLFLVLVLSDSAVKLEVK